MYLDTVFFSFFLYPDYYLSNEYETCGTFLKERNANAPRLSNNQIGHKSKRYNYLVVHVRCTVNVNKYYTVSKLSIKTYIVISFKNHLGEKKNRSLLRFPLENMKATPVFHFTHLLCKINSALFDIRHNKNPIIVRGIVESDQREKKNLKIPKR